ncbi:MAG: hypothetical protein AAGF95_13310 [Chloroflexota bacterium]
MGRRLTPGLRLTRRFTTAATLSLTTIVLRSNTPCGWAATPRPDRLRQAQAAVLRPGDPHSTASAPSSFGAHASRRATPASLSGCGVGLPSVMTLPWPSPPVVMAPQSALAVANRRYPH